MHEAFADGDPASLSFLYADVDIDSTSGEAACSTDESLEADNRVVGSAWCAFR
jgi:hypothetical protein